VSTWEPQLSDWIDGSVKPTIVGVYQRRFEPSGWTRYALWDGTQWRASWPSPTAAAQETCPSGHRTASWWRGLAQNPVNLYGLAA